MTFGVSSSPTPPDLHIPAWHARAGCAGHDWTMWFPPETGNSAAAFKAKVICRTECPVTAECLQFAMDNHEKHGIWGGLGEKQRRDLRRAHTINVREHGTHHGYNAHIRKREEACGPCKAAHAEYTAQVRRRRGKR
jgi:hypothetical protein